MATLSERRARVIRTLIETAPDCALRTLRTALSGENADGALSAVKAILDREVRDRSVRDAVFTPIAPLFAPRPDGLDQLQFPASAYDRLWRALKSGRPDEANEAAMTPPRAALDEPAPPIYDQLCRRAAQGLRGGGEGFAETANRLAAVNPGLREELIACLDLTPIARETLRNLPSWMARMTEERAATIRLIFKDAVAMDDDAGPRLLEILFAHLTEPWTILRIISALMLKPGDRYFASSELGDFGVRLLHEIDRRIDVLKTFDYDLGAEGGLIAAESLRIAAAIASEFEHSLALDRAGAWGERLARQKKVLAGLAEDHLRKVDKAVGEALPLKPVRIGGRALRGEPRLDAAPDELAVRHARALLTFFEKVRGTAALGGYGTVRAKVAEDVAHRLDTYLEELLAMLHSGRHDHLVNARAFLETVAEFTVMVHDEQAAQIVRRRAAAA